MTDSILDGMNEVDPEDSFEDDKSFNDSELQDIMSEIEDLEKEFALGEEDPMTLQEKIDAELDGELNDIAHAEIFTNDEVEALEEVVEMSPSDVLSFDKVAKPSPVMTVAKSEVAFEARGQMSLNLDFMVGSETAKLSIDPAKGLIVTMSGVELCISEDSGCTVSMENGMKFTIPLSSSSLSTKKKSA